MRPPQPFSSWGVIGVHQDHSALCAMLAARRKFSTCPTLGAEESLLTLVKETPWRSTRQAQNPDSFPVMLSISTLMIATSLTASYAYPDDPSE